LRGVVQFELCYDTLKKNGKHKSSPIDGLVVVSCAFTNRVGIGRLPTRYGSHSMASVHSFSVTSADGTRELPLSQFKGRVLVIVNTASMCGFTASNMEALVALQRSALGRNGAVQVLLFPCSQFANQEPKSACEVRDWAESTYGATSDLFPYWFGKVNVKGASAHPLFVALQKALGPIRWNFTKFVCDTNGVPICRLDPGQCGAELIAAVDRLAEPHR
jgi:glutathione peroxidase